MDDPDLSEDLDLSVIPSRKDSSDNSELEGAEFEKKLKLSMVQCQNENILN